ncbi:hypothetical protein K488DRAFT_88156 [Vararia minispora EC-137]|uniref:Uncharacterized protein n=1 Tax=Vararia minispora EC-137 TaxID=1314806 RepID=A0ACB8QDY0_9AGAM|nr:hypothetical protein K488DRAFT_88156 [Vararia minispora EC-137]
MPRLVCGLPHIVTLFLTLFVSLVAAAPWGTPFSQPSGVHITGKPVYVELKVPDIPSGFSYDDTIFIWPGVQPGSALREQDGDPSGIGNGILVPSLTYGRSCAPGGSTRRNSWWISGSYFNVPAATQDPQFAGCHGGNIMVVEPGEIISCSILNSEGSIWTQTCWRPNGQSVSYSLTMNGQRMNWASLSVKPGTDNAQKLWSFPVYIYNFRFTTSSPMTSDHCVVAPSGDNYIVQGSSLSEDGTTCTLSALTFWNSDVSATSITPILSL